MDLDVDLETIVFFCTAFIGLPWIVLHYITRWKTAATITNEDEALLEEMYQLARRLDERMETVERLVASEHDNFRPARRLADESHNDGVQLTDLERLLREKREARR